MRWAIISSLMIIIFFIGLLLIYSVYFSTIVEFGSYTENSNFTLNAGSESMQFYPNMRFPTNELTYRIEKCTLQKENGMKLAFQIIADKTSLEFFQVKSNEEIYVTCDSKAKIEDGLFIAGEGGPSNITQTDLFNVISKGNILLLRDSACPNPNIALHELLHVLGFDHSTNKNNVMYPVTNCKQTIGDDTIEVINSLYSTKSNPDLAFTNIEANKQGVYFNTEINIINQGLKKSGKAQIIIYGDGNEIKRIDLAPIEVGYGRAIKLTNILVLSKLNSVEFVIDAPFEEIDKENNHINLQVRS